MQIFVKLQIYKTMKKLQSNFTTPEQSKRLLELGVPEWTADCYFRLDLYSYKTEMCFTKEDNILHHYTPCWSVGRLMEIILLCHVGRILGVMYHGKRVIDELIIEIEKRKEVNEIDFSKLEE